MRTRAAAGTPIGILGYLDGEPIAWYSVAPKATFKRLGDVEDDTADPDTLWSTPASSSRASIEVRASLPT